MSDTLQNAFEKNQDVTDRILALACIKEMAKRGMLPYELWDRILNSYKGKNTIDVKWFQD